MRLRSGLSSVPALLAWTAMAVLGGCGTLGSDRGVGDERRAEQAQAVLEDEDDDCELLVVRRGEAAQIVEEKTPEMAEPFYLLGADQSLLEEFQIEDDEEEDCLVAFGLASGGGGLAPAAFGAAIPGAAIAAAAAAIAAGVGLGVVAGGGGGGATSTTGTQ